MCTQKSPTYTQKSLMYTQKSPIHTGRALCTLERALYTLITFCTGRFPSTRRRKPDTPTHCNTLQHTATHCNAHYHILAVSLISNESCIHSEKHWYSKKNTKKSLVCTHERPVEYDSFVDSWKRALYTLKRALYIHYKEPYMYTTKSSVHTHERPVEYDSFVDR